MCTHIKFKNMLKIQILTFLIHSAVKFVFTEIIWLFQINPDFLFAEKM